MPSFRIGLLGLLVAQFWVQLARPQDLARERLFMELSRLIQWKAFWQGPRSLQHYQPGKQIEISIATDNEETVVFMKEIELAAYLTVAQGDVVRGKLGGMIEATNAAEARRYFIEKRGSPGFTIKPGISKRGLDMPVWEPPSGGQGILPEIHNVLFLLPKLEPPLDYAAPRSHPPQLESLKAAARVRVSMFYEPICGRGHIEFPFFSSKDPTVYVYADLGAGCGKGIFPFGLTRSGWIGGQFSSSKPPNDWSYTIRRVRANAIAHSALT